MSNAVRRTLWISWQKHRRTREICGYFPLPLHELIHGGAKLLRYPALIVRTTLLILQSRPRILFVQNPSIVLAFYATLLRPVACYRLIVDAHNEAVEPHNYPNRIVRGIARFILRHADFTIVTNKYLAQLVEAAGGRALVLPDRLPQVPPGIIRAHDGGERFDVVLIATYAKDEPVEEIIEAAGADPSIRLRITGNPKRFLATRNGPVPDNVEFTGFLSDGDYWRLLRGAGVIIDLTLKDNCLVCGAYEGVAAGVPLILSGNMATRELFRRGVIYTEPGVQHIRVALAKARANHATLALEIAKLKAELEAEWPVFAAKIATAIDS